MLKTLIVEDEVLARLGLHQLVDWEALGFSLLEDAKTGPEALERIRALHPQVVVLDLNIPEINGIEIQRHIVESGLPCQTIVISCNDDFTTVKEIMRLGAFDFLRKLNLSAEALTDVLLRCKQAMGTQSDAPAEPDEPRLRRVSYDSLLKNADSVFFARPYGCVISVVADRAVPQLSNLEGQRPPLFAQVKGGVCVVTRGEHGLYLLIRKTQSSEACEALCGGLEALWNARVTLGVWEGCIDGLAALNQALICVEGANLFACYDRPERVLRLDRPVPAATAPDFDFGMLCGRLKLALSSMDEGDVLEAVSAFFDTLRSHDMLAVNLLKRMLMDILGLFSATAQRLRGNIEDVLVNGENYHYRTLLAMNSLRMIERWFDDFARAFVHTFFIRHKSQSSDILHSVFAYIDGNIAQPIQLSAVAKHIGISENYLSSYFKKEMGENFVTYVNIRKVEKAKELLRANCLVYQVSESLGFENNTYFTKVFKKYAGMSPDAYRKQFAVPTPETDG